jgi:hypothetical protein
LSGFSSSICNNNNSLNSIQGRLQGNFASPIHWQIWGHNLLWIYGNFIILPKSVHWNKCW